MTAPRKPRTGPAHTPDSPHYSVPRRERRSPGIEVTLPPEAHEALAVIAGATGESRSAAIARLLIDEVGRMAKKKK